MSLGLVEKLLTSFDELDDCISVTKQVLNRKADVPSDVIKRVDQYTDIVNRQRDLADKLKQHIEDQNWIEVSRHVKLINGLSAMIREDARAILTNSISANTAVANHSKKESEVSTKTDGYIC